MPTSGDGPSSQVEAELGEYKIANPFYQFDDENHETSTSIEQVRLPSIDLKVLKI